MSEPVTDAMVRLFRLQAAMDGAHPMSPNCVRRAMEAALSHDHDWRPVGLDSWRCECGATKTAIV